MRMGRRDGSWGFSRKIWAATSSENGETLRAFCIPMRSMTANELDVMLEPR